MTETTQPAPDELTLRDYFAGQALPGLAKWYDSDQYDLVARLAYAVADEMLAARNHRPQE